MPRIYLDNAATSWPKPATVYDAVDTYQRTSGVAVGRGGYAESMEVDRQVQQARHQLAGLIDARSADQIVFTYSGTDALTLAIRGTLRAGDHVVTTVCEHNSVLRPLRFLEDHLGISVTRVGCDPQGYVAAKDVLNALRDNTRLIAVVHASNVTGAIQPVAEIGAGRDGHPALFLVDAAQTAGHLPISVETIRCDLLAAPAHKGLLAPTGTGFLYLRPGIEHKVQPIRLGGTGTSSESDMPPTACPVAYEAGNHNVPGLVGLRAALSTLEQRGIDRVNHHELELTQQLLDGLRQTPGIQIHGPVSSDSARVAVVSFSVADQDPHEVAVTLEQAAGIQVRAGFHCAPRMHGALQTQPLGGTVRVSPGMFNTSDDVLALLDVLRQIAV